MNNKLGQRVIMDKALEKACIVGGGFYGCMLALELVPYFSEVTVIEKESRVLKKASFNNQARVHQGYHYPRSISTGRSSRSNYAEFVHEFSDAIYSDFDAFYAIASDDSLVSADGFETFCRRISAPLQYAHTIKKQFFNPESVENVYHVEEVAFDAIKLGELVEKKLKQNNVHLMYETEALKIAKNVTSYNILCDSGQHIDCTQVFVCAYSGTNCLLEKSKMTLLPIKYELAELVLVSTPKELQNKAFTVMDGPFFSLFPFPAAHVHSLSHVRYTPHCTWTDKSKTPTNHQANLYRQNARRKSSHFRQMIQSASQFMPSLATLNYIDSIWEVKATLLSSESSDGRPILMAQCDDRVYAVLGSKIDNVADLRQAIKNMFSQSAEQVTH